MPLKSKDAITLLLILLVFNQFYMNDWHNQHYFFVSRDQTTLISLCQLEL